MEFVEKARIKLEHWMTHNDNHRREYEDFARELQQAGQATSADQVREMIDLAAKSSECLRKALRALGS
jgi:ferric-dicitrate binding protein FerR (iron transport regulator)